MRGTLHHRATGIAIRAAGLTALGLSWLCGYELRTLHVGNDMGIRMLLLAGLAFVLASLGSAMLVLGPQLLDEIEVSSRWARKTHPHASGSTRENHIARQR